MIFSKFYVIINPFAAEFSQKMPFLRLNHFFGRDCSNLAFILTKKVISYYTEKVDFLRLHSFSFYKNVLYKNIEAEIGKILRIF